MIAASYDVNAQSKKFMGLARQQTNPAGGVFRVDND
jgi:hypothetical protein